MKNLFLKEASKMRMVFDDHVMNEDDRLKDMASYLNLSRHDWAMLRDRLKKRASAYGEHARRLEERAKSIRQAVWIVFEYSVYVFLALLVASFLDAHLTHIFIAELVPTVYIGVGAMSIIIGASIAIFYAIPRFTNEMLNAAAALEQKRERYNSAANIAGAKARGFSHLEKETAPEE